MDDKDWLRESENQRNVFLRGVARRLLRDEHLAEDVVQETWLSMLSRNRVDEVRSQRAFLTQVLRCHVVNTIRAHSARIEREAFCAEVPASLAVDELAHKTSVERRVRTAVERLHPRYSSVLRLRYYDDLPPREIARRLDLPVETVHTRHRRGLGQLKLEREFHLDSYGQHPRVTLMTSTPPNLRSSSSARE